ncbi:MAG: hypothetical protein WAO21_11580 [Verrucomicrobiia bacterium]
MKPADLKAYWKQTKWPKPNLVELAQSKSSPLAAALNRLAPEILAEASKQLDPFGWLLATMDVGKWSKYCRTRRALWMTRVWLASASQLRAERRLIHKAHGWADTWEELRGNPLMQTAADNFFLAQLNHASGRRRDELLAIPAFEPRLAEARQAQEKAFLRRLQRAKKSAGMRAGVSLAERYLVQHWLELPHGFPGLCFFSDSALQNLLAAFGLSTGPNISATKQTRVRLGLIQAGVRRHLIEEVIDIHDTLRFTSSMMKKPWTCTGGIIRWGRRKLWPH